MTPTWALVHSHNTDYQVPSGVDLDKVTVRMPYRLLYCVHASLNTLPRPPLFQRRLAGVIITLRIFRLALRTMVRLQ